MTSVELYKAVLALLNKAAKGNMPIEDFERLVNIAQRSHFRDNLPPSGTLRGMNKLSAFLASRVITLTNGLGEYNPGGNAAGDLFEGPLCWVSRWENPECHQPPVGEAGFTHCPVLPLNEWIDITGDATNKPTAKKPKALLISDSEIQVLPRSTQYLMAWYWRNPRPIVVGRNPADPDKPLEGGTGQSDPEWAQPDIDDIIMRVLALCGVPLQSDRLVQAGTALQGRGDK